LFLVSFSVGGEPSAAARVAIALEEEAISFFLWYLGFSLVCVEGGNSGGEEHGRSLVVVFSQHSDLPPAGFVELDRI
jgi:hypothetical protein